MCSAVSLPSVAPLTWSNYTRAGISDKSCTILLPTQTTPQITLLIQFPLHRQLQLMARLTDWVDNAGARTHWHIRTDHGDGSATSNCLLILMIIIIDFYCGHYCIFLQFHLDSGAMDSNDSFSLAMDSGEMAGFNGLGGGGHHGHGPLPPAHPHHGPPGLPHYPEHYDQPGLPQHPVFANCGKIKIIANRYQSLKQNYSFRWHGWLWWIWPSISWLVDRGRFLSSLNVRLFE